jgi:hypothetical protein
MSDYERVRPTPEEVADFRRRKGYLPSVHRVRCTLCGRRYWGSGIGIGSHRRACPGRNA